MPIMEDEIEKWLVIKAELEDLIARLERGPVGRDELHINRLGTQDRSGDDTTAATLASLRARVAKYGRLIATYSSDSTAQR
jgi:hypothetical protein